MAYNNPDFVRICMMRGADCEIFVNSVFSF